MSDFDTSTTELIETPITIGDVNLEYFNHVKKINDVFYDQVKISDQKAAYIFTFMLAFLVTSSEVRNVFTVARYFERDLLINALSALLALASTLSILSALLVVLPRHIKTSSSLFWGTWPMHRPLLEQAAEKADINYLFNEYMRNADVLSLIARQKYRFVGFAFRGLIATVLIYVMLLVVS